LLLCLFFAGFYATWTLWAFLLVQFPELDRAGALRAAVRVFIWIVPVLLFVRIVEGPPVLDRLCLRSGVRRGVAIGLAGFVVLLVLAAARRGFVIHGLRLPSDVATWLNPVLTAPLAEELLFRGLIFRVLRDHVRVPVALLTSALLFAAIHLPYWWMAGQKTGGALTLELASIFGYGVLFAGLFQWSESLWSPLVCHWLNNLFLASLNA
jgi:membrane protease YdiL (CAAX protease family)